MPRPTIKQESLALAVAVLAKLAEDESIRQELPGGGRIRFDRRLPFVCVYRRQAEDDDEGTERLLEAESASLVLPASPRGARIGRDLLRAIVENLASHFGSFLVVEIWALDGRSEAPAAIKNGRASRGPRFEIAVTRNRVPRRTIEALAKSLGKVRLLRGKAQVSIHEREAPAPRGARSIVQVSQLAEWNSYLVGIGVEPVFRHPKTGDVLPSAVRTVRRGLDSALKHAFFTFTRRRAKVRPVHYSALGTESIGRGVFTIDHQLAAIDRSFDLLLQATPVNAEAAWHDFRRRRFSEPPVFYYRPLTLDPLLLKRQLYSIPVEQIEDPTLAYLFRQKQDELDRQITLLSDVDSPRFLPESLQIYGGVSDWLLAQATELLERVPTESGGFGPRPIVGGRIRRAGGKRIEVLSQAVSDVRGEGLRPRRFVLRADGVGRSAADRRAVAARQVAGRGDAATRSGNPPGDALQRLTAADQATGSRTGRLRRAAGGAGGARRVLDGRAEPVASANSGRPGGCRPADARRSAVHRHVSNAGPRRITFRSGRPTRSRCGFIAAAG